MEMKNLCGKIPVELHLKVRAEIEQRKISTQQFIQQVIEEHFMEKGVNRMEARTIAVLVQRLQINSTLYLPKFPSAVLDFLAVVTATLSKICLAE